MTAPKYHLTSYGCQMNKLDSELVESKLRQLGYVAADGEHEADVVLLNTCSVRQHAEDRVWSKLGRLRIRKRSEPGLVVGVLGIDLMRQCRVTFDGGRARMEPGQ